ncbi:MAG TPA: PadR family transcriptional regulator [Phototrophicaceae bacterium]|nr:PadR family transcriptional regulator [Phototrophicaceae bacterium]
MINSNLNDVELTILSLVAEAPRYGAEIEQLIALRGLREWLAVGSASVYYILSHLEQQELITRSAQPGKDGAARTVYQISDAGRGVVQTAVSDLLRQPRTMGQGFSLGLANCGVLKPAQVYRALIQQRDALTHQLQSTEALQERREQEDKPSEAMQAMYSHGIALMKAELEWLNQFITDWRARHPAVERDETAEIDNSQTTPLHAQTLRANHDKDIQKIKRPKVE